MRTLRLALLTTFILTTAGACALLGYHADPMVPFGEHTAREFKSEATVYGVNDKQNKILFVAPSSQPPELYLYEPHTDLSKRVRSATELPGVDKITYDNGAFRVWYEGSALVEIVVERQRKKPATASSDVAAKP